MCIEYACNVWQTQASSHEEASAAAAKEAAKEAKAAGQDIKDNAASAAETVSNRIYPL